MHTKKLMLAASPEVATLQSASKVRCSCGSQPGLPAWAGRCCNALLNLLPCNQKDPQPPKFCHCRPKQASHLLPYEVLLLLMVLQPVFRCRTGSQ